MAEQAHLKELLIVIEKREKVAESKAYRAEAQCQDKDQCFTKLSGEVEILQADQAKKSEELIEVVGSTKAYGALWIHDYPIQQYPTSFPMFK